MVVVVGFFFYRSTTESENSIITNGQKTTVVDNNLNQGLIYKDGQYYVTQDYMSPGGKDTLGVSLTIAQNAIIGVEVTNIESDGTSKNYIERFIGGVSEAVVGKSLVDLKLGVVSGSSLATGAFNQALGQIRAEALVK